MPTASAEVENLLKQPMKGALAGAVTKVLIASGDESKSDLILTNFEAMPLGQEKFEAIVPLSQYLAKVQSLETFKRGIDDITGFVTSIPEAYRGNVQAFVENVLRQLRQAKSGAGQKDHAAYIDSKLAGEEKKGF